MKTLGLVLSAAILGASQADAATLRVTAEVSSLDLKFDSLRLEYVIADPYGPNFGYVDPGSDVYDEIVAEYHPLRNMKLGDVAVVEFTFPNSLPINSGTDNFDFGCISGAVCQTHSGLLDGINSVPSVYLNHNQFTGDWSINVETPGGFWINPSYGFSGNTFGSGSGLVSGLADGLCCGTFIEREGIVYSWVEPQASVGFTNVTIEGLPQPSPVPLPASILFLALPAGLLVGSSVRKVKRGATLVMS